MTEFPQSGKSRRRRFAPLAVVAGVGATAALALSMTGTLSAFTAQITNSANTVTNGTLVITETQVGGGAGAGTTCNSTDGTGNSVAGNTYTCSTINKYGGGTLTPGASSSQTVTIANTGTTAATTATLVPQACVQSGNVTGSATDLCSQLLLTVTKTPVGGGTTTTLVNAQNLTAFFNANKTGGTPGPLNFGAVNPGAANGFSFTFTVTLPSGLGNTYQGLTATQPLVWNFSAGS